MLMFQGSSRNPLVALQTQLWCIDVNVKPWFSVVVKKLSNTGERECVFLQDCVSVALIKNLKGVIPKEGGLQKHKEKRTCLD